MALPTLNGIGRLTADPSLSFTPQGVPVAKLNLAFNARRKNPQTGEWEDGDAFYVRATLWKEQAEHVAESLNQGDEVLVTGRMKSTQWKDRETGEPRYGFELVIDAIGPNTRWNTVSVNRVERKSDASDDAWNSEPPKVKSTSAAKGSNSKSSKAKTTSAAKSSDSGGFSEEPPF